LKFLAESEGFEPPDLLQSTVFKTAAIDHSANSPPQKYKNQPKYQMDIYFDEKKYYCPFLLFKQVLCHNLPVFKGIDSSFRIVAKNLILKNDVIQAQIHFNCWMF
jgi:hypothetical protein